MPEKDRADHDWCKSEFHIDIFLHNLGKSGQGFSECTILTCFECLLFSDFNNDIGGSSENRNKYIL